MKSPTEKTRRWLASLCVSMVLTAGCATRRATSASAARTISFRAPIVPAPSGANLAAPPQIAVDLEPPELPVMRSAPAKPRVAPAPVAEPKAEETQPFIEPQISTQELEAAKTETQRNLDSMQRNLGRASGRSLNATQQDLISKINGFSQNAQEAMSSGDWVRAKNLSKKAEVLSEELAGSL
jgi:hypothetical protein